MTKDDTQTKNVIGRLTVAVNSQPNWMARGGAVSQSQIKGKALR